MRDCKLLGGFALLYFSDTARFVVSHSFYRDHFGRGKTSSWYSPINFLTVFKYVVVQCWKANKKNTKDIFLLKKIFKPPEMLSYLTCMTKFWLGGGASQKSDEFCRFAMTNDERNIIF